MAARGTRRIALLAIVAIAAGIAGCEPGGSALPPLGTDLERTSVSGLSSGGYMAGQFQFAHSHIVVGAGIIAGGPYGCAESAFADNIAGPGAAFVNLSKAMNGCMLDAMRSWGVPNVAMLAERARQLAAQGRIDSLDGIARDRVYIFTGAKDRTVVASIVAAAMELYVDLGVPTEHLKFVADVPAAHAFVTSGQGAACGQSSSPYITDCGYDLAGALLAHIYGTLEPRTATPAGEFIAFDQREFTRDLTTHGLADTGVVYVPPACRSAANCRVHVAFHGCAQDRARIGDAFINDTGYAQWADGNRLVVLFPQVVSSTVNPQACWDWWGYTGRDYLTRKGPQIIAVRRMLDRLAARHVGWMP